MVLKSSIQTWEKIERLESAEQKRLLQGKLQAREPIRSFTDIRKGDHLVIKNTIKGLLQYEHHFLCIGISDDGKKPEIIHYSNTPSNASTQMSSTCSFGTGVSIGKIAKIKRVFLPHDDFIKSEDELQVEGHEVERVVWPEELRRYDVDEVVKRAVSRNTEDWYDLAENNCESFVMWCLCDLNITLQMTSYRRIIYEALVTAKNMAVHGFTQGIKEIIKRGVSYIDDIIAALISALKKIPGSYADDIILALASVPALGKLLYKILQTNPKALGVGLTVLTELVMAVYDIYIAYQKWNRGDPIITRNEFIKEVTDIIVTASFRVGGSVVGILYGQLVIRIPYLGIIIWPLVGVFFGDYTAKLLTEFGFTQSVADHFEISRVVGHIPGALLAPDSDDLFNAMTYFQY